MLGARLLGSRDGVVQASAGRSPLAGHSCISWTGSAFTWFNKQLGGLSAKPVSVLAPNGSPAALPSRRSPLPLRAELCGTWVGVCLELAGLLGLSCDKPWLRSE